MNKKLEALASEAVQRIAFVLVHLIVLASGAAIWFCLMNFLLLLGGLS